MARMQNRTRVCQICKEDLPGSARSDKMTCGDKSCAKKWTRFYKRMQSVEWKISPGLQDLAFGEAFKNASYHQVEIALSKWKMLYDAMGEAIIEVERSQVRRAKELGIFHSSQSGFFSFMNWNEE